MLTAIEIFERATIRYITDASLSGTPYEQPCSKRSSIDRKRVVLRSYDRVLAIYSRRELSEGSKARAQKHVIVNLSACSDT